MSSSDPIILYDIPSKGDHPRCWSWNPWKTRLVLNYKGLDYKTEWTEYPDLEPKFKELGVTPLANPPPLTSPYTSPTIRLPSGQYQMESRLIAAALESLYPSPSLHLTSPILPALESLLLKTVMPALIPIIMPRVPRLLLPPRSVEYFQRTRAARFGMSLDELEKTPKGGDAAWEAARDGLRGMADLLIKGDGDEKKERSEGPFVTGAEPSYADLVLVSFLKFAEVLGVLERVLSETGDERGAGFVALLEASRPWLKRDDY